MVLPGKERRGEESSVCFPCAQQFVLEDFPKLQSIHLDESFIFIKQLTLKNLPALTTLVLNNVCFQNEFSGYFDKIYPFYKLNSVISSFNSFSKTIDIPNCSTLSINEIEVAHQNCCLLNSTFLILIIIRSPLFGTPQDYKYTIRIQQMGTYLHYKPSRIGHTGIWCLFFL